MSYDGTDLGGCTTCERMEDGYCTACHEALKQKLESVSRDAVKYKHDVEQYQVQLAGCLTAAEGHTQNPAKRGDYGWSLAYQTTLDLRRNYDALRAEAEAANLQLAEVTAHRDRLRNLVNDIRGMIFNAKTIHEISLLARDIMRRIEGPDEDTEKRVEEKPKGRCSNCNHDEDEHATPGGECVAAAIYCDCNSFRAKRA